MVHAAAAGKPYTCFVRPDTRIPFMVMEEAIDATLGIMDADAHRLTRQVYNIGSFSPSAGEVAALVKEFFPKAEIAFEPDTARQGIVDTWPEAVDDSAAQRDWGFRTRFTARSAFAEILVPRIRARYG
jgi:nucleoside-diphosphate-sugar epimerase